MNCLESRTKPYFSYSPWASFVARRPRRPFSSCVSTTHRTSLFPQILSSVRLLDNDVAEPVHGCRVGNDAGEADLPAVMKDAIADRMLYRRANVLLAPGTPPAAPRKKRIGPVNRKYRLVAGDPVFPVGPFHLSPSLFALQGAALAPCVSKNKCPASPRLRVRPVETLLARLYRLLHNHSQLKSLYYCAIFHDWKGVLPHLRQRTCAAFDNEAGRAKDMSQDTPIAK